MTTVGKPNLIEYRTRLLQILPTIGITLPTGWSTTHVNVFTAPGMGQAAYPFWIIERPSIISVVEAQRIRRWRISWLLFLARDDDNNTEKAEALADTIDDDVVDVMEYFESRSDLVSTTLTTNMAGYLPGSVALTVNGDGQYRVQTGWLFGSAYTLALTHRISYDTAYR